MPVAAVTASVQRRRQPKGFDAPLLFSLPLPKKFGDIGVRPDEVMQPYEDWRALNSIPNNDFVSPRHALKLKILFDEQANVTSHRYSPEYVSPCNLYAIVKPHSQGIARANFSPRCPDIFCSCCSDGVTCVTDKVVGDCIEHANCEAEAATDRDDERARIVRVGDVEILSAHLDGDRFIDENRLHSSTLILVEDGDGPRGPQFRSFALASGSAPVTTPRCARCGAVLCGCADSDWSGR